MPTFIIMLAFTLSSNIFAAQPTAPPVPVIDQNTKATRIAFFIDDHNERFAENGAPAVTWEFARTLSKNASHITIVSNYVLKNMILRKYTKNPDTFLAQLNLDLKAWDIYVVILPAVTS